ncbi:MAG: LamG-like jellyroll fold domain-containing protein, partial [Bdellovibrionales bacterium]
MGIYSLTFDLLGVFSGGAPRLSISYGDQELGVEYAYAGTTSVNLTIDTGSMGFDSTLLRFSFIESSGEVGDAVRLTNLKIDGNDLDYSDFSTDRGAYFHDGILNLSRGGYTEYDASVYVTDTMLNPPSGDVTPAATVTGTIGDDNRLYGTNDAGDVIDALAGNDYVVALDGDDTVNAGDGNDYVLGRQGVDTLNGDGGNDRLYGGAGNDIVNGGDDDDRVYGNDGNDTVRGDDGNDRVYGNAGDDDLYGGNGNDHLSGGDGADELYGEAGEDHLFGGDGDDILYGGNNNDRLRGNAGNDELHGDAGDDDLNGYDGNDDLYGGTGNDTLNGEYGDDDLNGDENDDVLIGGQGADTLDGGGGNDIIYGGGMSTVDQYTVRDSSAFGLSGVFYLEETQSFYRYVNTTANYATAQANAAAATLNGVGGHLVTITSQIENDFISSIISGTTWLSATDSAVNDTWVWNAGPEAGTQFWQGNGSGSATNNMFENWDTNEPGNPAEHNAVIYTNGVWHDWPDTSNHRYVIEWNADDVMADNSIDTINGGTGNDTIYGGGGNDILDGDGGHDIIYGGVGDDDIVGDTGNDALYGQDGNDTIDGGLGTDSIYGGDGNDTITDYFGTNTLYGNGGNDDITGGSGTDTIYGDDSGASATVDGLVAFYKMDETGGTTVSDSSGNGHHGTYNGGTPTWDPYGGMAGGAIDLSNTSGQPSIDISSFDVAGSGISLMAWVYYDSVTTDARIISKTDGSGTTNHDWCLMIDDNSGGQEHLEFRMTTVNGYSTENLEGYDMANHLGEWVHIGVTYDDTSDAVTWYINGVSVGTDTHNAGGAVITGTGEDVSIGNQPFGGYGGRKLDGFLDEVRVYDREVTSGEMAEIYGDLVSGGDDIIDGGNGNDTIYGGEGNDTINGGNGDDTIYGVEGNNTIYGDAVAGPTVSSTQGWAYQYYDLPGDQTTLAEAGFTLNGGRDNANAATSSGITQNTDPAVFDTGEHYALKYETTLTITTAGTYTFRTSSDDGSMLFLDGVQIVDNDGLHGVVTVTSAGQSLAAGTYTLEATFFERTGGNVMDILMAGPDTGGGYVNLENYAGTNVVSYSGPGTNGDDTIHGGEQVDTLYGGGGSDTFVFDAGNAFSEIDTIMDFSSGDLDALDISDLLTGFNGNINEYLLFTLDSGDTLVQVDADGTSGGTNFQTVAVIDGIIGLDEESLYS